MTKSDRVYSIPGDHDVGYGDEPITLIAGTVAVGFIAASIFCGIKNGDGSLPESRTTNGLELIDYRDLDEDGYKDPIFKVGLHYYCALDYDSRGNPILIPYSLE